MISMLTDSFSDKHNFDLFHIGSKNINKLIFRQITLRRIFKKKVNTININKLRDSVYKDNINSTFKDASFYCLVIYTNFEVKKFLN